MKGPTEGQVAVAFRRNEAYVLKIPDDARNRKPCDHLVWWRDGEASARSIWVEVKDCAGMTLAASDVRPGQRVGIAQAALLGIPYWLVIWWRQRRTWTAIRADRSMDPPLWVTALGFEATDWPLVDDDVVMLAGAIMEG